jgi:hypothetical protein
MRELDLRKIAAVNQRLVKIEYKGLLIEEPLRFDVLAEDCLLLEHKETEPTKVLPQYICGYIKVRQKGRTISACEEFCPALLCGGIIIS